MRIVQAVVIEPDGTGTVQDVDADDLAAVQALIGGGYIEVVASVGPLLVIADEEGLLKKQYPNDVASAIAGKPLVGIVAFLPPGALR